MEWFRLYQLTKGPRGVKAVMVARVREMEVVYLVMRWYRARGDTIHLEAEGRGQKLPEEHTISTEEATP